VKKPVITKIQVKKIINMNERERHMIDEANEMGVHNIKYFLPNKETNNELKGTMDAGV
jgi:hypothetical protein